MNGWIVTLLVLAVYATGWYKSAMLMTRWSNEHHERRWPRLDIRDYKGEHLGISMLLAVVWPIVLPMRLAHAHLLSLVPPTTRELEQSNQKLRDEIARLEREAGIR